ncbi:MAG: ribosome assembly factor SBDS [Candidatus Pacearchaeota archaeon]
MSNIARIKAKGKHYEILVDVDKALTFKKTGKGDISGVLEFDEVFTDSKKGERAGEKELKEAFGTTDVNIIAQKIIKDGEIQISTEYREKQREGKFKQVVDFLVRNAIDPRSNRPYTPERIETALDESGVNISNKPIENQMSEVVEKLSLIMPIKVSVKKILVTIPAQYTGYAYGIIQPYKESEEWKSNGDLKAILNIPSGLQMEFYDKLNSATHGSVLSEEIKEK